MVIQICYCRILYVRIKYSEERLTDFRPFTFRIYIKLLHKFGLCMDCRCIRFCVRGTAITKG